MADYFLMCQPKPKLSAIQFGWSGEKAPGFLARMKNDALIFKPTVATTCYGMNDGGYVASTPAILETYRTSMTGIVDTLKANGVRFIVVGAPGAVDTFYYKNRTTSPEVYNQTLADLGQVAKEIAEKEGVGFADVHGAMMSAMAKARRRMGPNFAWPAAMESHPTPNGHVVMAYAFLKALGCDGDIGTITVDLKADTAEATEGTKVLRLRQGGGPARIEPLSVLFLRRRSKGPPGDPQHPAFCSVQCGAESLPAGGQEPARLVADRYLGNASKTFPAEELAKGVNLADAFPTNPFSAPFLAVQQKIAAQQSFETIASKQMLHSLADWNKALPDSADLLAQLPPKLLARWQLLRDESAAVVVPVQHEIKIEAASDAKIVGKVNLKKLFWEQLKVNA